MTRRHVIRIFIYPAAAAFCGWLGADSYGAGECAAVVLMAAIVLVCETAFAHSSARAGRVRTSLAPALVIVAFVMHCGARQPTTSRVEAQSFDELLAASSEASWPR